MSPGDNDGDMQESDDDSDEKAAVPSMRILSVCILTSPKASAFPFLINRQGSYVDVDMSNSLR
jgi:hypothetical protein